MKAKTRALVSAAALVLVILGAFVIQNYMQMEDMEDAVDAIEMCIRDRSTTWTFPSYFSAAMQAL